MKVRGRIGETHKPFRAAAVEINNLGKAEFIDSLGLRTFATDSSVKIVIPSMGDLFNLGSAAIMRAMGWNAEALPVCDREALDLGRSITTSKECLPIINIVGELLKYIKYRKNPNEKLIMLTVGAGGCCRVGQYDILLKTTIDKLQLENVATLSLSNDNGYAGLGLDFRLGMVKAMYAFDVMDDIRSAIKSMAVDRVEGMRIFNGEIKKIEGSLDKSSKLSFYQQLKKSAQELSKIELIRPITEAKYIGVVGEIFVRRDHFSLMGIPDMLAENGFVMLDAPVSEWVRYTDFLRDQKMFEIKTNFIGSIEAAASTMIQDHHEKKIKRIFSATGLYEPEIIDIKKFMAHSKHVLPYTLTGEPGLSTGASLYHLAEKYCGVLNVGPFGCMNSRMTEAVSTVEMTVDGKEEAGRLAGYPVDMGYLRDSTDILPFLSVECDGNPFSQIIQARLETFMLQANRLYEAMQQQKGKSVHKKLIRES